MCNSQNVEQEVKKIIANVTGNIIENVTENSRIIYDLGADSLDTIDLVMEIESTFEIELNEKVFDKYGDAITVNELVYEVNQAMVIDG